MPRQIDIIVSDPSLKIDEVSVVECLAALDEWEGFNVPCGSIGVNFVDETACCQLHGDFFGDPDPTDVMTFPGDPDEGHAGDIAICPLLAMRNCQIEGTAFHEELTLYLVHAWLHLAGLDDRDPESTPRMRAAEKKAMQFLLSASRVLRASWQH